jgi:hypothetical protein
MNFSSALSLFKKMSCVGLSVHALSAVSSLKCDAAAASMEHCLLTKVHQQGSLAGRGSISLPLSSPPLSHNAISLSRSPSLSAISLTPLGLFHQCTQSPLCDHDVSLLLYRSEGYVWWYYNAGLHINHKYTI